MLKLRDIMTRAPVTISPEATLREAVELLSSAAIGGLPVVTDSGTVVGVVSTSDILTFTASTPGVPVDRSADFMEWGELEQVDDEESPTSYYVNYWAESEADLVGRMNGGMSPEWDLLEQHTVDEVMTRQLQTLPADAELREAAAHMIAAGIHRLLVVDGDRLAGLVTTTDLVRVVAEYGVHA